MVHCVVCVAVDALYVILWAFLVLPRIPCIGSWGVLPKCVQCRCNVRTLVAAAATCQVCEFVAVETSVNLLVSM